eukprot:1033818-Pyramimonas_sp.AAC.1
MTSRDDHPPCACTRVSGRAAACFHHKAPPFLSEWLPTEAGSFTCRDSILRKVSADAALGEAAPVTQKK